MCESSVLGYIRFKLCATNRNILNIVLFRIVSAHTSNIVQGKRNNANSKNNGLATIRKKTITVLPSI